MEWASSMLFHPSPCQNLHWRNFTQAVRHLAWTKTCPQDVKVRSWSCATAIFTKSSHQMIFSYLMFQMQTDLKHMNTSEFKLSELTGNCFTYNNLAARSSACWCKLANHKQELSLQTGMTWLGQQTKLDKPISLRGTIDVFNTLTGHASCMT